MNKDALLDLNTYVDWAWEQIKRAIGPDDDDVLLRPAPGSGWPALRNCLGHIILAYERWLPAIIQLHTVPLPDLGDDDLRNWSQIDEHRRRVRKALTSYVEGSTDAGLAAMHNVDIDGTPVRYSRGELITHLLLHERGHHGDLTTLFWQVNLDAETMLEYRFHLGRHP